MKTIDEWNNIISNIDKVYIYGAGTVAKKIASLLAYSGKKECLKGYVVSSKDNNPDEIMGVSVSNLKDITDKKTPMLVSLSEVYHPDIFKDLKEAGFEFVLPAHKYYSIDVEKEHIEDVNYSDNIDFSIKLSEEQSDYRIKIIDKYYSFKHAFGGGGFYQSFPMLGIKGTRDTSLRIKTYGLEKYISQDISVLDIGCNIGFLDMEISSKVKSIVALEYSDILVDIANEVAQTIGLKNINFVSDDYNEWQKKNQQRFDIIFSFAVHGWLNVTPEKYAEQIVSMLNDNGIFIIESQQLSTDMMFETFVEVFRHRELHVIDEGLLNDDGETDRKFVVLRK